MLLSSASICHQMDTVLRGHLPPNAHAEFLAKQEAVGFAAWPGPCLLWGAKFPQHLCLAAGSVFVLEHNSLLGCIFSCLLQPRFLWNKQSLSPICL